MKVSIGLDPDLYRLMLRNGYDHYLSPQPHSDFPGLIHIGEDKKIKELDLDSTEFIFGFDDPEKRKFLADTYFLKGGMLISELTSISEFSKIASGCTIGDFVFVGPHSRIGRFVKLNIRSSIHHHVQVDDYSVIGPGAIICGRVQIGTCTFIGAGVTVLPNVKIGQNVLVGAGSVVVKDIPNGHRVAGTPARVMS